MCMRSSGGARLGGAAVLASHKICQQDNRLPPWGRSLLCVVHHCKEERAFHIQLDTLELNFQILYPITITQLYCTSWTDPFVCLRLARSNAPAAVIASAGKAARFVALLQFKKVHLDKK